MSDGSVERKSRGAYFTPAAVCELAARWALRSPDDRALEPSCGEAAFLLAATSRLQHLGRARPTVTAFEIHDATARTAAGLLEGAGARPQITVGDFLAQPPVAGYDAVLGNPPFIRYQTFTGESRAAGARAALAEGVRLTGLSSSWAPFVVHASAFLRPGGRLALVLPGELLSSNYAAAVRSYLQSHFAELTIVVFDGQLFPGAQTETLLVLAAGRGGSTTQVGFSRIHDLDALDDGDLAVERFVLDPDDKWTTQLVDQPALDSLGQLDGSGRFDGLASWGRISLGAVTGANSFFTLSADEVRRLDLHDSDVLPLSPPGSRHLRALAVDRADHAALAAAGRRVFLFRPDVPSSAARHYIAAGAGAGVDRAYKCRVRNPWWRVPLPPIADVFLTYMNAETPQFATNPMGLRHVNSVHGIVLAEPVASLADVLPIAALNSATMLSAEVTGRAYGGGILKLEPREAARLVVPSADLVGSLAGSLHSAAPKVRELLRSGRLGDAVALVDDVVLVEGCRWSADDVRAVRHSRDLLARRRQARGRTGAPRG